MGGIWAGLWSELRRYRWTVAGLVMLVGIFGGTAIASGAGARRTDSAFPRFLRDIASPDLIVPNIPDPSGTNALFPADVVRKLPGVKLVEETRPVLMIVNGQLAFGAAHEDPRLDKIYQYKMLSGRLPDPTKTDEVVVAYVAAQRLHVHVGERIPFVPIPPLAAAYKQLGVKTPAMLHIVGLEIVSTELPTSSVTGADFHLTPALFRLLPVPPPPFALVISLQRGQAGVRDFESRLQSLAGGKRLQVIENHAADPDATRAIHVQALALWILTSAISIAGVLLIGQMFVRQAFLSSEDYPRLHALGMTSWQLWTIGMLEIAMVALFGTALAAGIAVAVSGVFPLGLARLAEPHPGFAPDLTAIGIGVLLVMGSLLFVCAGPIWRMTVSRIRGVRRETSVRPTWVAGIVGRLGLPWTTMLGTRLALERGQGRRAVPVRTALTVLSIGVLAIVTSLAFGATLTNLLHAPRLYGSTWDADLAGQRTDARSASRRLSADPRVDGLAFGVTGIALNINGSRVDADLIDPPVKGAVGSSILEGRAPVSAGEIALGTRTLREIHLAIGQIVQVGVGGNSPARARIVGRAVLEPVASNLAQGDVTSGQLRLGEGALITYAAAVDIAPRAIPPAGAFIRLRPGVARGETIQQLTKMIGGDVSPAAFQQPSDILNFGRVQYLPLVLAGILGLLALAALTHVMISAVRRRARDLAIFKTLGMSRAEVAATIAWQATTLIVLALVVGIPLGILAARWLAILFSGGLGIAASPQTPFLQVALVAAGAYVVALMIAAIPARQAANLLPATVLRAE